MSGPASGKAAEVVWYGHFFLVIRRGTTWEWLYRAPFSMVFQELTDCMWREAERRGLAITNYDPVRRIFLFDVAGDPLLLPDDESLPRALIETEAPAELRAGDPR